MLGRHVSAITLAVLTLLPAFAPLAAAAPEACTAPGPGECAPLMLYFQTANQPMSSLPGDAASTDSATIVREPGVFTAETPPLADGLAIHPDSAFRVHLAHRETTAAATYETTVTVRVVDAYGRPLPNGSGDGILARQSFVATRAGPARSFEGFLLPPGGSEFVKQAEASLRDMENETSSGPLSPLTQALVKSQCPRGSEDTGTLCGPIYGDYGRSTSIRPCREWKGGVLNPFVPIIRSTGACTNYTAYNATREAADEGDPIVMQALEPVPRTGVLDNAFSRNSGGWNDFALNATPLAWFPQDPDSFVVPAGLKLRVEISTRVLEGQGAVSTWTLGRADAPSGLAIRVTEPAPFSEFAWTAENIGDGSHTGAFSRAEEADDYAFVVEAGERALVRAESPNVRLSLFSPHGKPMPLNFSANDTGRYILRATAQPGASPLAAEYRFSILVAPSQPDQPDGMRIEDGETAGHLGPFDHSDSYVFSADRYQNFRVQLLHAETVDFTLSVKGATTGMNVSRTGAEATGYTPWGGDILVTVSRGAGTGPYTLSLWRDPDGALSGLPNMTNATGPLPMSHWDYWGPRVLDAAPGGAVRVATSNGTFIVDQQGATLERGDIRGVLALAHDSDGGILYGNYGRVMKANGSSDTGALARSSFEFIVGPESAIYSHGPFGNTLVKTTPAREETPLRLPDYVYSLTFAPDGTLYAVRGNHIVRVALDSGNLTTVVDSPARVTALAFDADGNGYASTSDSRVLRFDPATGKTKAVALGSAFISSLQFSGTRLFAVTTTPWNSPSPPVTVVAAVDLGVPGFEGFVQTTPFVPAPDLVITSVVEERVGIHPEPAETRVVHITVRNDGETRALGDFPVTLARACTCPALVYETRWIQGGLAAGETKTVAIPWNTAGHAGAIKFRVSVDDVTLRGDAWSAMVDAVVESDETNNMAVFRTKVATDAVASPT